jgi:hypothetical protein
VVKQPRQTGLAPDLGLDLLDTADNVAIPSLPKGHDAASKLGGTILS